MEMTRVKEIIDGAVDDLSKYPANKGITLIVADRLHRLSLELERMLHLPNKN